MGRKPTFKKYNVVPLRIDSEMYSYLQDLAATESLHTKSTVTIQALIRQSLKFTYEDGERLRECFRRSRHMKAVQRNRNFS